MVTRQTTEWVRWLARHLPPHHVAELLGIGLADVAEALGRRQECPADVDGVNLDAIGVARKAEVRRLYRRRLTPSQIVRKTGLSRAAVYAILDIARPPSCPSDRQQGAIKAQTAVKVRRLIALGYEPETIAEVLALDLVKLRAFLDRAFPAPKPPREPKPPRPPKPGSKSDPERWRYLDAPPAELVKPVVVAELPAAVVGQADAELVAPPVGIHTPDAVNTIADAAGEWHHFQETFKGRPKLDWESAESIRRERAEGATRPALAKRWRVSLGTIDSILAGRTYREPPAVESLPPIVGPMPATSPRPAPVPHVWRTPKGIRGDAWRDD